MPDMTTSYLPPAVQAEMDKNILSTPTRNCIYSICAERYRMNKNSGSIKRFKRYNQLAPATAPLGNSGITPAPETLIAVYIDAQMSFYGAWISCNEQVQLQNEDNVLNSMAIRLGVQMRLTEDELAKDMLAATANVIFCTNGFNGDNPTNITTTDILDVTTMLQTADAMTIAEMEEGEMKFGTSPIYSSFFCYTNTRMIPDLTTLPGYVSKFNYSNQRNCLKSEIGSYAYARFLVSSAGSYSPNASFNGANVYHNIFVGHESHAMIDQDAYGPSFIYTPPSIAGGPMHLNGTVAWKTAMAHRILNDQWLCRLDSTLNV